MEVFEESKNIGNFDERIVLNFLSEGNYLVRVSQRLVVKKDGYEEILKV